MPPLSRNEQASRHISLRTQKDSLIRTVLLKTRPRAVCHAQLEFTAKPTNKIRELKRALFFQGTCSRVETPAALEFHTCARLTAALSIARRPPHNILSVGRVSTFGMTVWCQKKNPSKRVLLRPYTLFPCLTLPMGRVFFRLAFLQTRAVRNWTMRRCGCKHSRLGMEVAPFISFKSSAGEAHCPNAAV